MQNNLIKLLVLGTILAIGAQTAPADAATKQRVPAKLVCGPNSANPGSSRDFQVNMTFTLVGDQIEGRRTFRSNRGGTETFKGTVSSTGAMLISGDGKSKDGGVWKYEFSGSRNDTNDTVVTGVRTNTNGIIGTRECKIVFSKPRAL